MAVLRIDKGEFRAPKVTAEGFLRADAYVTRAGVFEYRRADGSIRRELRPPEEVFAADSLASLELAPMTLDHPPVPVDASNARTLSVGSVGDGVSRDGDYVRASVMVTDAAAVRAVLEGRNRETSCGYTCDVEDAAGEYQGTPYDCVQKNIRYNHVALVPRGRAGPEVRVRLDSDSAEQVLPGAAKDEEAPVKRKIKGVEYELNDQLNQALDHLDSEHATEISALRTELEKAKGRADQLDADLKRIEKERKDASDPMRIRELVRGRVQLEKAAQDILGSEFKADAEDLEIRRAVIVKVCPDVKLDGRSAEYIEARFDAAVESYRKANPVAEARRGTAPEKPQDAQRTDAPDPDEARARMIRRFDGAEK